MSQDSTVPKALLRIAMDLQNDLHQAQQPRGVAVFRRLTDAYNLGWGDGKKSADKRPT